MNFLKPIFDANAERDLLTGKMFSTLANHEFDKRKALATQIVRKFGHDEISRYAIAAILRETKSRCNRDAVEMGFAIASSAFGQLRSLLPGIFAMLH